MRNKNGTETDQNLSLGTSDFSALKTIWRDLCGQNRTHPMSSLLKKPSICLSVLEGSGKSLLISTFESLFKQGLKDFKGLAIEKLWAEEQRYLVVRLDFSEAKYFSSPEEFSERICITYRQKIHPCRL